MTKNQKKRLKHFLSEVYGVPVANVHKWDTDAFVDLLQDYGYVLVEEKGIVR